MSSERLQKIIAAAGIASRRKAEEMITSGLVEINGKPDAAGRETLRRGMMIPAENRFLATRGGRNDLGERARPRRDTSGPRVKTAPAKVRIVREADNPWYELTLTEGKNRQIRRMFEEIGHHVEKIKRDRYGPLRLDVPPGEFRRLSAGEVEKLKAAAGLSRGGTGRDPSTSLRAGSHAFRKD